MQRQNIATKPCKSPNCETGSLDVALAKPGDDELFYTASLHFLKKRLQEKSKTTKVTSQSCCNLTSEHSSTSAQSEEKQPSSDEILVETSKIVKSPLLPMNQVLPFPKSSKDSFFTRVKKSFRKYRQRMEMNEVSCDEESKSISNFKFPRCERPERYPLAGLRTRLVGISEERLSNERIYEPSSDKLIR